MLLSPLESATKLNHAINLRLALLGFPTVQRLDESGVTDLTVPIFARYREATKQIPDPLCFADQRIQAWLDDYLAEWGPAARLPAKTFVLDEAGLARGLSLPLGKDEYSSELLKSYRLRQGVLHNPANDRRTTQGVFHIAEGGLGIPDDKLAVPKKTYAKLLEQALNPPAQMLQLPFTANENDRAACFVSLLLRPLVCPAVPGFIPEKRMEIRFFAPGSLVSNLDFVESVFGNAGDPYLPDNDAGLDLDHWTGHTGCVILAPHLTALTKISVGLPAWENASERARRDGMCWKKENELYNNGSAFKITARDSRGVMVTIVADNYYGYCKKEVKTQISFSANLFGLTEEEHAGGAMVYPSYTLEDNFSDYAEPGIYSHDEVLEKWGHIFHIQPEGHAVHRKFPQIVLVPETSRFDLTALTVSWSQMANVERTIKFLAENTYIRPSGYRVQMKPVDGVRSVWRLVGTVAEGTLCHKPCTVSGGGKSEISKSIANAILPGHVFVAHLERDCEQVDAIMSADFTQRFRDAAARGKDTRSILSPKRSLGSVIKLLTPSRRDYTLEYNEWLRSIPEHIKELILVLKRFYKAEWGTDWRPHFSVDTIDGRPAYELKLDGKKIVTNSLRVGFKEDGSWRVFSLRGDFHPAAKVQVEDDITASVVAPRGALKRRSLPGQRDEKATGDSGPPIQGVSYKFVQNCENRLFQRPDDAIHRGYDRQAEADMASAGTFISNYEALTAQDASELIQDAIGYSAYTEPMQALIRAAAAAGETSPKYFVSSAHPRIVDGKPTKNPRYLQMRPDLADPVGTYLAGLSARLHRKLGPTDALLSPVNVLVPGRRNNPPEKGIRSLAVFNPIHYLDLPELFMEFISSMTGKSPSTTGAGSEAALTKGPFNALPPIIDLNATLVSMILTGHDAFLSAAAYVGPKFRVDHDVSMLIPELFARMTAAERDARQLIEDGCLERCEDFEHEGKIVLASRLGYRITTRFVRIYFGRIFNHPDVVFTEEMLRPELQDKAIYADGMDNIVTTHRRVAESYFTDGGIIMACPPLKALLHIMARGDFEGKGLSDPDVRRLFSREEMLKSDWYEARLEAKQKADQELWSKHVSYLEMQSKRPNYTDTALRLKFAGRLDYARQTLREVPDPRYRDHLFGSLGLQAGLSP